MAAVQVSNASATVLYTPSGDMETIVVQNLGPNPIYLDYNPAVTTSNGIKLLPEAVYSLVTPRSRKKLYAIAASALQVAPDDTRVITETA